MATRLGWILEGLHTGIVTTRYPAHPDPSALAGLRVRPLLRPERCAAGVGCSVCVEACLPDALQLEGPSPANRPILGGPQGTETRHILALDLGRCIGCGLCAVACPHEAIALVTDPELATHGRGDLVQTALITCRNPAAL